MTAKRHSATAKNVELGELKLRVDRIAERDPVMKSANTVIRAAVERYANEWDLTHPDNPSTK